eukprot:TRINITY_DN24136_c0_g1_i1.p1 TRINITY_DN24136_c0_g1~~TRINITY_DN24136_c0_g1_i1.p1  ORF type:complete len:384 (+),score=121.01 TRINITY_DN24136_c0_g1_i1:162-1154(+)
MAKQLSIEAFTKIVEVINPRQLLEEPMMKTYSVIDSILQVFEYDQIVNSMKTKGGIEVKDRKKNSFKTYAKCFLGSEAVTWFSKTLQITREDAVEWGKYLQQKGVIEHYSSKAEFGDNDLFYRFPTKKEHADEIYRIRKIFGFEITPQMGPLRKLATAHLSKMKNWVIYEIEINTKKTEFVVHHFFIIARELIKINNWHSLHGIIAALEAISNSPTHKDLWGKLNLEDVTFFNATRSIFLDPTQFNEKNTTLIAPCVPSLEAYLSSMENLIKESGPIKVSENLINVKRLFDIGNVISNFIWIQSLPLPYECSPIIQQYIEIERPAPPLKK